MKRFITWKEGGAVSLLKSKKQPPEPKLKERILTNQKPPETIIGLTEEEVSLRIQEHKVNSQEKNLGRSVLQIIKDNSFNLFNLINLLLALLLIFTGHLKNSLFFFVAVVNTCIGIYQEIRAKQTVDKLSILAQTHVVALRNQAFVSLSQEEIVLDDVLFVETGDQILADSIVLSSEGLELDESLLTGEADSVEKKAKNQVMSGSFVTAGSGYIKVTAVGEDNYVNTLTKEAKSEKKTPSELMRILNTLIKFLTIAIVPIGLLLFYSQYQTTHSFNSALLSMTASMISMIPEGLILLTSVAFAVGAANLAKKRTLVQSMPCIETLARVDTICLDKTGTITDGSLTLKEILPIKEQLDFTQILAEMMHTLPDTNATAQAIRCAYPLEQQQWTSEEMVPFSSFRKWSGATFTNHGTFILGAPEFVLSTIDPLLQQQIVLHSQKGYRVMLLAHTTETLSGPELPKQLDPYALLIIEDSIRENAVDTFSYFSKEDVTLKVISGDNPLTVSTIAQNAGIQGAKNYVDLSTIQEDADLKQLVEENTVFGRVTPAQKRRLIRALKENNHTTCMTGDGVNDVLALKEADVSVAMASGSDASRAVADVVLLDSDFSAMIHVLKEGRRVINNIERVASMYLVKTIYTILLSILFIFVNMHYPFEPIQLSPINSFTIGIPSFFLALAPNYHRVKGDFLHNILRISVPAALTVVTSIVILQLANQNFALGTDITSTMCVLLTGFTGFHVLIRVSDPLTVRRKQMIVLLFIAFISTFLLFGNFFELSSLLNRSIFFYLPLALGIRSIFNYISLMVAYLVHFFETTTWFTHHKKH